MRSEAINLFSLLFRDVDVVVVLLTVRKSCFTRKIFHQHAYNLTNVTFMYCFSPAMMIIALLFTKI